MALSNDTNRSNDMDYNKLLEILASLADAAQSSKTFASEMKDASVQTSKAKKDAQALVTGMLKESIELKAETDKLVQTIKELNHQIPQITQNTINTIESGFAFSSQKLNRGFKLEKFFNPIFNEYRISQRKMLNEFDDQIEDIDETIRKVKDDADKASLERQKQLLQERRESIANASTMRIMARDNANYFKTESLKVAKQVLSSIYSFVKQQVTSAINSYNNTMQQTYNTIQSYNNYTVGEYDKLFKRLKQSIDDSGLSNIVNINELQQSYTQAVSGGLTGTNAEKNAYYEQIAKQAGVTFDWNDSNWLKTVSRMSKSNENLDELMQGIITATENMTEAAGNAFAFTNGQINTMVDNLNQLQSSLNLSNDAYVEAYKSFGTVGSMLSEYSIDASKIYGDITNYAVKGLTAGSTASLLNMGGMTQSEAKQMIQSGDTQKIMINYLTELQKRYDKTTGEFTNVASAALSESLSPEEIESYKEYMKYLSENGRTVEDEFKRIYNYNEYAYDNIIENLDNTETTVDRIANTLDNMFAFLGKFVNNHPILGAMGSTAFSGIEAMIGGWVGSGRAWSSFKTITQNFTGNKSGFNNSNVNTDGFTNDTAQQLSMFGTSDSSGLPNNYNNTSPNNYKSILTKGNKITNAIGYGTGAILTTAGLVSGSVDLYKTIKNDRLLSEDESWKASTASEKAAKIINSSTTSGVGAIIGTAVGGPLGTAIGSAAGLAVGKIIESVAEKDRKSLENINELIKKNTTEIKTSAENQISTLQDLLDSGNMNTQEVFDQLVELGYSNKEIAEMTEEQRKNVLSKGIQVRATTSDIMDEIKADHSENTKLVNASKERWFETSSGQAKDIEALNQRAYEYTAKILSAEGLTLEEAANITKDTKHGSKLNDTLYTVMDAMGVNMNPGIFDGPSAYDYATSTDKSNPVTGGKLIGASATYGQSKYIGDYSKNKSDLESKYNSANSEFKNRWEKAKQDLIKMGYDKAYGSYVFSTDRTNFELGNISAQDIANYYPVANNNIKPDYYIDSNNNVNLAFGKIKSTDSFINNKDTLSNPYEYIGSYAVGTTGDSTIPYDNYLAYLHKGEQVRTSAEVAVEKAERHVASSNAIGELNSAVMSQTNTIIDLLTKILDVTTVLSNKVSGNTAKSYNYAALSIQ